MALWYDEHSKPPLRVGGGFEEHEEPTHEKSNLFFGFELSIGLCDSKPSLLCYRRFKA